MSAGIKTGDTIKYIVKINEDGVFKISKHEGVVKKIVDSMVHVQTLNGIIQLPFSEIFVEK